MINTQTLSLSSEKKWKEVKRSCIIAYSNVLLFTSSYHLKVCVFWLSAKTYFFIASCYLILKPGFCACPEKSCRVRGTILCTCGSRCSSRIWQLTKSRTTSWENILCIILKNAQVHLFSLSIKIQTQSWNVLVLITLLTIVTTSQSAFVTNHINN